MNGKSLLWLLLFVLLALAIFLPPRRVATPRRLRQAVRLILALAVIVCGLFHFLPQMAPTGMSTALRAAVERLQGDFPGVGLAHHVGSLWVALGVLVVLVGRALLRWAEPGLQPLPPNARPRLVVLRGQKPGVEYPIWEGLNYVGRTGEKPVDIDLSEQESPDRIWCSRQHACISFENDLLQIEDLNSANGTHVNGRKVQRGIRCRLNPGDVLLIGTVELKFLA
jgi:hypothetical protein